MGDFESKIAQAIANAPRGELMTGFLSKHVNPDRQYNEANVGLGYMSPNGWMAGGYKNSLNRPSFYLGKEIKADLFDNPGRGFDTALALGAVTGYEKPLVPLALPQLIYNAGEGRRYAATVIPPIKGVTPMTFALQARQRF